jgi:hypothetical protein
MAGARPFRSWTQHSASKALVTEGARRLKALVARSVGLALLTAWLGGELVYRLRVGVDDAANLDATNSLSEAGIVSTDSGSNAVRRGRTTGATSR